MNNSLVRILLMLSLVTVVIAACGTSSTSPDSAATPAETAVVAETPAETEVVATDSETDADTTIQFTLTDTKQEFSYDNEGNAILFPAEGEAFYGQDAQYVGVEPSFQDNGDGTVTDLVTGLLWEKTPTFDTYQHEDGVAYCENLEIGGIDDWRMPTIKELYSLADYRGELLLDGVSTPYIDSLYFDFEYPAGDRQYAGQYWSSTRYEVTPANDTEDQMKYFGFNFADGHIKAYGTAYSFDGTPVEGLLAPGMYVRCVSGEENVYGANDFVDNGDGTVTDMATGLMWQQVDDGQTRNWEEALAYAEDLELAGYDDWRLPNAKELQSIVMYGTTEIPAIDESFFTLTDPDSYFWTSTTHGDFKYQGIYIAFGHGWSIPVTADSDEYTDEHGAGAQRSDPKTGDPDEYNYNMTSENASDLYRIYNYVFAVRNVDEQPVIQESTGELPTSTNTPVEASSGQAVMSERDDPDLAAAAATLGITEQELLAALGDPPPDFAAAAATLNITIEALESALAVESPAGASSTPSVPSDSATAAPATAEPSTVAYTLVETGQGFCYNSDGEKIDCPAAGEAFYGQDAQFTGAAFDFTDNGDGTVTDNVTALTWEQTPNSGPSSWPQAQEYCEALTLGDLDDWRMPSLKELFSISNFSAGWPYLDTDTFDLTVNDSISKDEQYWSSNYYVGKTSEGQYDAAFGVNHATGHIKAYPALVTGPMGKYVRCVSGDEYGINDFIDNGDGTITDNSTALMWTQTDSGVGMDWEAALAYAQEMNAADYLGYSDWRLPNVKELQSIVDYGYAPDAQDEAYDGPALNPLFSVSEIINEAGNLDYPYYWTSTSARFQSTGDFYYAWYVAAGRAVDGNGNDSHGAGAVRFDTKSEDGPAGEGGERYDNYVMLVRGGDVTATPEGDPNANDTAPDLEFTGAGGPSGGEGEPELPDFAAAAEQLGVTEAALMDALGAGNQGPPDFAAAADALGVAEAALQSALGMD